MTSPRRTGVGPVYALYGHFGSAALTLTEAFATGLSAVRVPLDVLLPLETGSPALVQGATAALSELCDRSLIGAVGLDECWNTALGALNPGFALASARSLVADKATLYTALEGHGAAAPGFIVGTLGCDLLSDALDQFGPRPVLKPVKGAGSRGVYRYRQDLPVADNLALYRELLAVGHIDSGVGGEGVAGPAVVE
jgi:hypothetical protein